MADRTFQRGILFSCLGALLFFIVGILFCEVFSGLKDSFLFRPHSMTLDVKIIVIKLIFNLFALIGFTVGISMYLFGWPGKKG